MEYGVFLEPSFNWTLIKASIVCAILFISLLSILLSFNSITKTVSRGYRKRYETKTALLGSNAAPAKGPVVKIFEQINGSAAMGAIIIMTIVLSFAAMVILFGMGLSWPGMSDGCYDQKYASQGTYKVIDANLVYQYDTSRIIVAKDDPRIASGEYSYHKNPNSGITYLTEKTGQYYILIHTPQKPVHYALRLEGKTDPSLPVTINRCVLIPYNQVSENQKFTPTAQKIEGISKTPLTLISVQTPTTIEKYGDKWWKFRE